MTVRDRSVGSWPYECAASATPGTKTATIAASLAAPGGTNTSAKRQAASGKPTSVSRSRIANPPSYPSGKLSRAMSW